MAGGNGLVVQVSATQTRGTELKVSEPTQKPGGCDEPHLIPALEGRDSGDGISRPS